MIGRCILGLLLLAVAALPASTQMLLMGMGPGSSSSGPPPTPPAPASANGFTNRTFYSNLAVDGLTTTDVNGTNGGGFTWYTVPFQGETAPQPQTNWTYNGSDVYLNSVADNTSIGRLFTAGNSGVSTTSSVAGSTITVTAILAATGGGVVLPGQIIAGAGITPRTFSVLAYGTNGTSGTGGTGTYALSGSVGTVASEHVNFLSHVGQTFKAGGYFEACFSWDPTQSPANGVYHPSFWITDVFGNANQNKVDNTYTTAQASPADHLEIDFFEAVPTSGAGTVLLTMNSPDWTISTNYSGVGTFNSPTGAGSWSSADFGSPTFTTNHCYETLWIPSYQNSGTGKIVRYFDGVIMSTKLNNPTTYTSTTGSTPVGTPSNPNGIFSVGETDNFNLIINGGPGTFGAHFTSVSVWQTPTSVTYIGSGPTGGTTGVASSNFAAGLTNGGLFSGSQTITISDGGDGGTITPSVGSPGTSSVTVTPTVGTNSFTFTYTAATNGVKTITFTNAQGWPDQSPLPYTAAAVYAGPCDAGVGTFKAFWGVRKCATAYAGNGPTVKRTSDSATCVMKYLSNGLLDISTNAICTSNTQTVAQFCNATVCNLTNMVDTSGAAACTGNTACNITPATITGLTLQFNCSGSIPCFQAASQTNTSGTIAFVASATQPFTITLVPKRVGTSGRQTILQATTNFQVFSDTSANGFDMFAGTASEAATASDNAFHALQGVVNGASSTWKVDNGASTTTAATPGATAFSTAIQVGTGGNGAATVQWFEIGVMAGGMTTGNQTTLYNNQSAFYGSIF